MKILIVKPSSLGDVIQMLQVVEGAYHAAKEKQIHLDIHWIIRDCFADFLKLSPYISKYFIFQRHKGILGFKRLIQEIRRFQYDWIIDGQGLLRSGVMTFLAKGTHKIGRKDAREGSCLFYQNTYGAHKNSAHAIEFLNALFTPLNLGCNPQRPLSLKETEWNFTFKKGGILLFPDSRGPQKEWPYFYELTQNLLEKTSHQCIWLGQRPHDKIPQHSRFINFIGQTKISDLPLLIKHAHCVIANDSGPIHLAAALKRPLVGIYGPTDSHRYGPYPTEQHCILQAPNNNLRNLSIDVVTNAVLKQLD